MRITPLWVLYDSPVGLGSSLFQPAPSFPSSSALLQTTSTASFRLRDWRRAAVASAWVTPRRVCPFIDNTSSPFWMVPSWAAKPLGNTLWTCTKDRVTHTHAHRGSEKVCTFVHNSSHTGKCRAEGAWRLKIISFIYINTLEYQTRDSQFLLLTTLLQLKSNSWLQTSKRQLYFFLLQLTN